MAQVLNTLAHEIRTPLAVSQGYLKLYVDGRLTTPDDQRRALQQMREALGVIAVLCADMSRVSALAETTAPALLERMDPAMLTRELQATSDVSGALWGETPSTDGRIATNAPTDLVRAVAVGLKSAFDEDKSAPHHVEVRVEHGALIVRAATADAMRALPSSPDGEGATAIDLVRGGKGLSLIWATFVLDQHGIETWHHQDHKASIGFRIPLVTV